MPQEIIKEKALTLLNEPKELLEIPIQRAVSALKVDALTVGHTHFHIPEYIRYPRVVYLSFNSKSTKDAEGNYDSPIFQSNNYNGRKPLWQEFRETVEEKIKQRIDHVFFGIWEKPNDEDSFFMVSDDITDETEWCFIKNTKGDISIAKLSAEDKSEYKALLDDLRLKRAIAIVKEREERVESRMYRENAITYLTERYNHATDRFNFGEESFKFRQFNIEFLYTSSGLLRFDDFYKEYYLPYRFEEKIAEEWQKKSKRLNEMLTSSGMFHEDFILSNAGPFKFSFRRDGCIVESDLIDDQTGKQFHKVILSQDDEKILEALEKELIRIFERKRQMRHATIILQNLAVKY